MGVSVLCMGLPNAPRTAWEVKFSDGIRLMEYFCLSFSCARGTTKIVVSLALSPQVQEVLEGTNLLNDFVHCWVSIGKFGS